MKPVLIYTTPICGFCHAAKRLLDGKGVAYEEIDVLRSAEKKQEMMEKSGRRTVPQIWIGERHVGGFDELAALERQGDLNSLLGLAD